MPPRKLKIELHDHEGTKYVFTVEGRLTKDKVARLLEIVELLGGVPEEELILPPPPSEMTLYDRLKLLIERYLSDAWFTSREVKEIYEHEYGEPVKLSTVSTYLARMAERGFLVRAGPSSSRRYKLRAEAARPVIRPF
ncbi:hypothetical protein DRO60_05460 [Candidatus Bathyarchaeota archaeon]|nr:MAG: hypothetical protein DRO60_05460 [Candidatus Bathyarchaeota archaeon]